MARYVAEGASVTLLTCTLGEEGEILVPELEQLAADQADQLGGYRIGELRAAMAALGVTDIRFLGGAGPLPRLRDDGHAGQRAPAGLLERRPRTRRWRHAVAVVREVRPQVVVTYDENGGYGHPDHIQAHRVAMAAVEAAADPAYRPRPRATPWDVAKVYWCCVPALGAAAGHRRAGASSGEESFFEGVGDADELPFGGRPTTWSPRRSTAGASPAHKHAAMRAHPTQIHGRRAVLRAVEQPRPGGARHRVLPAGPRRARAGRGGPEAGRTTCSPGCPGEPAPAAAVAGWACARRRSSPAGWPSSRSSGCRCASAACWCRCRSSRPSRATC